MERSNGHNLKKKGGRTNNKGGHMGLFPMCISVYTLTHIHYTPHTPLERERREEREEKERGRRREEKRKRAHLNLS